MNTPSRSDPEGSTEDPPDHDEVQSDVAEASSHNAGDIGSGAVVAIVGAVFFWQTFEIKATDQVVGPATFPQIIGGLLFVLGVLLAVSGFVGKGLVPTVEETARVAAGEEESPDRTNFAVHPRYRTIIYFALFFAYLFILVPVGFLLSTTAFLFAAVQLYSPKRWLRNAIFAITFAVVVYFGFKFGLNVYLPPGILG